MFSTGEDVRERFGTRIVGSTIYVHDEIDSTNLSALRLAKAGAGPGTIVLARTQTAGRGRLGRDWRDTPGGSLLVSVLVAPPALMQWAVTSAAALAVADAIRETLDLPALIKWPNDVMVHDRKVAGILAEGPAGGLVAVGIGVNVAGSSDQMPEDLAQTAGFLSELAGRPLQPGEMLAALAPHLDAHCIALADGGAPALIERIRELNYLAGRRVTVRGAGEEVSGEARGWADTGALIVVDDAGETHQFEAGLVTLS